MKASDFHDILTGNNNGFSACPGYDLVTGIGSPVANKLVPDFVPSAKGMVSFSTDTYQLGSSATVTVDDLSLVGNPSCTVTVTSSAGDSETVILPALGGGMFRTTIATSGGTVTRGDGILEVVPSGTITVTYNDANDGTGHSAVVTDQAAIWRWTITPLRRSVVPRRPALCLQRQSALTTT